MLTPRSIAAEIGATATPTGILTPLPRVLGVKNNVMERLLVIHIEGICGHPAILSKIQIDRNEHVVQHTSSRDVLLRKLHNHIRLTQLPGGITCLQSCQRVLLHFAALGTRLYPAYQHRHLFIANMVNFVIALGVRSEERRVGKECRSRWSRSPYSKIDIE